MPTTQFLITSLIIALVPGTGVIFTVSTGIMQGRRAALFAALGCTAGIIPHLLATILGLAALMHTSALAFQTLKYAGVVYLLYLAYATWQDTSTFQLDTTSSRSTARGLMLKAVLLNLLNPKLTIFFLAFLPQFISPAAADPLAQMLLLSGLFMAMTLVVFAAYGLLAHAFRTRVIASQRVQTWLRRSFAAAFAALGIRLACAER
ncbi:LysE family translocator [Trichlorobacter lovleyi]|uniref:LysE family translocator n=1 Tax=Trichlorobacter lovleyi TaxID=313985 RepID=UPI0023F0B036|nr:LysE family translocator [Trichlorobacter lovleyi]